MCGANYIGTEHVLLGLLGEPEGLACRASRAWGCRLRPPGTRSRPSSAPAAWPPAGTSRSRHGRRRPSSWPARGAAKLGHDYRIGTEHILLGLIREGEEVAAQVLKQHADLTAIREAVLDLLPAASAEAAHARRWLPPQCRRPRRGRCAGRADGAEHQPGRGHHLSEKGRPPRRLTADRLPPPAARRPGRPRHRRCPGPGRPRSQPGPGQAKPSAARKSPAPATSRPKRRAAARWSST